MRNLFTIKTIPKL